MSRRRRNRSTPLDRLRRSLRLRRWGTVAVLVLFFLGSLTAVFTGLSGCESTPSVSPIQTSGTSVAAIKSEPLVRVRVRRGVASVEVAAAGGLRIGPASAAQQRALPGP